MSLKILHTGDLHIGSFPGPEENGENARFKDIKKCLNALVEEAKKQKPDLAVIAGDIFHQAKVWSDRGLKEQQTAVQFIRNLETVCPVVVMRGTPNHDSEEQFKTLESTFFNDKNVDIIINPSIRYYNIDGKEVQVACIPGFDKGFFRAKHPGLSKEDENVVFTDSVEKMIFNLKEQCKSEIPSVLVSHYTITGCNMESGQTAFFSKSEPVVSPDTLSEADYDLVCFGHIHRPQQISGCRNTFYCGAISALNFNDEAQDRGFWIHEIMDDRTVRSQFFNLPTREYKTILLNDEDVAAINDSNFHLVPQINDKDEIQNRIVRVLYNCTDELNKAFSHPLLEKYLCEEMNAFWVQEITPSKISISVDKKSLDAEDSPENNLIRYLEEKEFSSEDISKLLELARPIIAEVTEKAKIERHTGLFVPVEIEVKNYRNYREEKFSFQDVSFCAINGDNGVGKSSLFMDAMIDALYEEPREGSLTGWICNTPEVKSGAIKFTFLLGEKMYRVTRTRLRSGKATLNISEFVNNEWIDRSKEKLKDTQEEIINIIGMDSLTLKACALIMQDQYGLFLQADKESRMNILGNILGLGIYSKMEDVAASMATDINRDVRQLKGNIEIILSDISNKNEIDYQIESVKAEKAELDKSTNDKLKESDTLKILLHEKTESASRVLKLQNKVSLIDEQISAKENALNAQDHIITSAKAVLSDEQKIMEGIKLYASLQEKEKEMIEKKAAYDSLAQQSEKAKRTIDNLRCTSDECDSKIQKNQTDILRIQDALDKTSEELSFAHTEYEKVKCKIAELEKSVPQWKECTKSIADKENVIQIMDKNYESSFAKLSMECHQLQQRIALLNDSGCPNIENATCKFLADALSAKEIFPQKNQELILLQEDYEAKRAEALHELDLANEALKNCLYNPDKADSLNTELKQLEGKEKEYNGLEGKRTEFKYLCERMGELCGQKETISIDLKKAENELAEINEKLKSLETVNEEYLVVQNELKSAIIWLEKEKELPVAREQLASAIRRSEELEKELRFSSKELKEVYSEIEEEQQKVIGIEALKERLSSLESEIELSQNKSQKLSIQLGGLQKQSEQMESKLKQVETLKKEMKKLSSKASQYEVLKKVFSQDGVPHNIIRSIIPIFESTATSILNQMSKGHMSVELVTEKVLKSNAKKEVTTLDIIINDEDTGRLPYLSRSGGEKVKAALSVILALSEIKSSKADVQIGFLFIDEPPFLDAHGAQAYCDALEAIQKRYANVKIMAITHDPAMKARFPQSVEVVKTASGSKAIVE